MRLNLVNSKEDRQKVFTMEQEGRINLVNLLKKYGEVVDFMTEPMLAQFFRANQKGVEQVTNRHGKEFEKYGYRVYKRSELLNLQVVGLENIPNRGLRLYPIKAVILMGMMLTESEVAEQLRSDIMDILFGDVQEPEDELMILSKGLLIADKKIKEQAAIIEYQDEQLNAIPNLIPLGTVKRERGRNLEESLIRLGYVVYKDARIVKYDHKYLVCGNKQIHVIKDNLHELLYRLSHNIDTNGDVVPKSKLFTKKITK